MANNSLTAAPRFRPLISLSVVAILTLIIFLPCLKNGFVNWDDPGMFLNNPNYRGFAWENLKWMWTTFHMGLYMPLTWLSHALDYTLWGLDPFGYHLGNLVLHVLNAILVALIAFRFIKSESWIPAVLAALFFSIHPLRVESVAWATERRDVLSGFFLLCSLYAYLAYTRPERSEIPKSALWASLGFFCLSLLSKASGAMFPIVLLILDVYPLRRLSTRTAIEKAPFFLLSLAFGILAVFGQNKGMAAASFQDFTLIQRVSLAAFGSIFYLQKTIAPIALSPLYELPIPFDALGLPFIASGFILMFITVSLFLLRRSLPSLLTTWLQYLVLLAPVAGLVQSGPQIAADRYSYLPCIGFAVLLGVGINRLCQERKRQKLSFIAVPMIMILLLGYLAVKSRAQVGIWRESETLWNHALRIDPTSPIAHNNLANVLLSEGHQDAALEHYNTAIRYWPTYAEAYYNAGVVLQQKGELDQASENYQKAIQIRPDYGEAYNNLGVVLESEGKSEPAIRHFEKAIELRPNLAPPHNNWGRILLRTGKVSDARAKIERALSLDPNSSDAHYNLGNVLSSIGDSKSAIPHYQRSLELNPNQPVAHHNLAVAFLQIENFSAAEENYRTAIELSQSYAQAHNGLGYILMKTSRLKEAIEHFRQALRIKPDYENAKKNLSLALNSKT